MSDLPRRAISRTARLASLPLGYAGRSAVGLGRRLGGASAESVAIEVQQRTAEQLFRTLGQLKGGAMKVGQAMSIFEAAFPDDVAGPYRDELTRLQDSAPAMPTQVIRQRLGEELGPDWRDRLVWFDPEPAAAASIGQVHRGRWADEREVAVKVQYPGAEEALVSDLRQLGRLTRSLGPLLPGIDLKALIAELQERTVEELDYELEADAQRDFAAAYHDDPDFVVPPVVESSRRVLITEWLASPHSLATVAREGSAAERDHYGRLYAQFLFGSPARTGLLHADPHPGNYRVLPGPDGELGRLGVLDYGAVARLPDRALPSSLGGLLRIAMLDDYDELIEALRREGYIRERIQVDAEQLRAYLAPLIEPARTETFRFTRAWMQEQFMRLNDPRAQNYAVATRLNLPPSYLLIHRAWTGAIGVLSQLDAEIPFAALLRDHVPGFASPAP